MLIRTEGSKSASVSESWKGMCKLLISGRYRKVRLTLDKSTERDLEADFCRLAGLVGESRTRELV